TQSSSPLIEVPARSCDIQRFYGDATMTQHLLTWKPKITLKEGLQRFLRELQDTLNLNKVRYENL
ncbi:MAG: NAD(P)-dependent oxidoreductase, partial [Bacteroidota bacterium]